MPRHRQLSIPRPTPASVRASRPVTTLADEARDPKAGVAHRKAKLGTIRHKVSMTPAEWAMLDRIGAALFPELAKRGQRPSRGMAMAEVLNRV